MAAILYIVTGIGTILCASRVSRLTRGAALVLLLLPLTLTARALFTGAVYGPADLAYTSEPLASMAAQLGVHHVTNPSISDTYTEFFPWNDALRRAIRRGEWPLWNPYELSGNPLAGSAQVAPYHPITLIGLLVSLPSYFSFAAAMMFLLAAVSAFLLIRDLTGREEPALFGAAAWMASTHLIFFAGTALANSVSVLPLVLFGARRLCLASRTEAAAGDGSRRQPGVLMIALLLLLLSGHPESALHVVAIAVLFVAFEAFALRPIDVRRLVAGGLFAGIGALLLAAIFLLPHLEAIGQSEEYIHRSLGYKQSSSTPAQMAHRLIGNAFPFLEGAAGLEEPPHAPAVRHGWLATSYAGSLLFAPAIFALMRSRVREKWFFAAALLVGLAAAIGAPGFTHLMNLLPGFGIAVNDRMVVFATLALVALASLGLDEFLRAGNRAFAWTLFSTAIAIACAALFLSGGASPDFVRLGAARAIIPIAIAAAAVLSLPARQVAPLFIALLLIQRAVETSALQPVMPARTFYPPFAGLSAMRSETPSRIVAVGDMLTPEIATHYGLEDVRGFQAVTFARYDATFPLWAKRQPVWFNRVDDLGSPFLDLMNVRFALAPNETTLPAGWRIAASTPNYRVLENAEVLPRAFVPRMVHTGREPEAVLAEMAGAKNFGDESWIEEGRSRETIANGPGVVDIRGAGSRLQLHARMAGGGWVVISNSAWKGWQCERPIRFANHAFMAIYLPRGEHRVTLTYRPPSFVLGAIISLLALGGQVLIFAFRDRGKAKIKT